MVQVMDPIFARNIPAVPSGDVHLFKQQALREVIRVAAVRDLVALGESGAFDFLLEPGAEEQMWG